MRLSLFSTVRATAAVMLALMLTPSAQVLAAVGEPIPQIPVDLKGDSGNVQASADGILVNVNGDGSAIRATVHFDAFAVWGTHTNESAMGPATTSILPTGTVIATFPKGYEVTSAATQEASSPCLSKFTYTATTVSATETGCAGAVTLGGITFTATVSPSTGVPNDTIVTPNKISDSNSPIPQDRVFITYPTFDHDLKQNAKGDGVKSLQTELMRRGFLPAKSDTGTFSAKTVTALKKFQKQSGLKATGKFDQSTRDRMNALIPGASGDASGPQELSTLPSDCDAGQLNPTININANGHTIIRGQLGSFSGQNSFFTFSVGAWRTIFYVNTATLTSGGSFSDISTFAPGDIIDVVGQMEAINYPGYSVVWPDTIRDKTLYCKSPVAHGGGNTSGTASPSGQ